MGALKPWRYRMAPEKKQPRGRQVWSMALRAQPRVEKGARAHYQARVNRDATITASARSGPRDCRRDRRTPRRCHRPRRAAPRGTRRPLASIAAWSRRKIVGLEEQEDAAAGLVADARALVARPWLRQAAAARPARRPARRDPALAAAEIDVVGQLRSRAFAYTRRSPRHSRRRPAPPSRCGASADASLISRSPCSGRRSSCRRRRRG